MAEQLIRVHSLARRYMMGKQEVYALNGVDLQIERGEFVALVGPSGSGKSTLLNMLGGLDRPSSGEIWVDDLELGKASDKRLVHYRRERLGFIFQSFNLLPTRTAVENVEVPLMLAGVKRRERRERALELLSRVGLASRANHRPSELSGGEQQRVAVARSLANNPQVLLADEPTGNLDSKTGAEILRLLQEVQQEGRTMVLVTHDSTVASHADRIVHLLDGSIQRIETLDHTIPARGIRLRLLHDIRRYDPLGSFQPWSPQGTHGPNRDRRHRGHSDNRDHGIARHRRANRTEQAVRRDRLGTGLRATTGRRKQLLYSVSASRAH